MLFRSPDRIKNVSGTSIRDYYVRNNSNGTESGQSYASVVIFENAYSELKYPGGYLTGINTTSDANYLEPRTFNITIDLTEPTGLNIIGTPPYNPYMIVNMDRSREVHLIDKKPTDLADGKFFGTEDDHSIKEAGRYYVTKNNLPYAIDIDRKSVV